MSTKLQRGSLRNRFSRSDERVRHGDHYVAGLHSAGHQSEAQGVGAAAHGNRMAGIAESRKRLLKIFDHGAADEAGGPEGFVEYFSQPLFEFKT